MNKLQTQFDVSSLLLSDNSIHFDVHGVFDVKYAGNETLKDKTINSYTLDPRDIGYDYISLEDIKGGDPKYNAECFLKMIDGNYSQFQKIVELNAGAAIYLSGKCTNIKDGALIASKTINEGITKEFITKIINE